MVAEEDKPGVWLEMPPAEEAVMPVLVEMAKQPVNTAE